ELCSLTFQKEDVKKSNLIGTALFGDGAAALLVMGEDSSHLSKSKGTQPKIKQVHSYTKKNSMDVMGWKVSNTGLEVVYSQTTPSLEESMWIKHAQEFLNYDDQTDPEIQSCSAHPGGKKVLEAMKEALKTPVNKLRHSYEVLNNHG